MYSKGLWTDLVSTEIALDEPAEDSIDDLEGPAIEILQINDRVLDTPIQYAGRDYKVLLPSDLQLRDGDNILMGYELLCFDGIPDSVWNTPANSKQRKKMSPICADRSFGIYSTLYLVKFVGKQ